jgi:spore coat polysaccharide biosynthesis protein SpsF
MTTAILITARLKSTRLPLKAIKEIKGRPMICHLIDRLKLARIPQRMVLCTSTVDQDDPLVEIAKQEQIDCFRGDPEDVLLRVTNAAEEFGVTTLLNCTGDNPFVDPEVIDQMLEYHAAEHNEFTSSEGLPLGTAGYVVSTSAMRRACDLKDQTDTEIWGPMFTETGRFRCGVFKVHDPRVSWSDLRLTVDTPQDFELVTKIFDDLYQPDRVFPLSEIVALCRDRPDLVAINSMVQQRPGSQFRLKPGV